MLLGAVLGAGTIQHLEALGHRARAVQDPSDEPSAGCTRYAEVVVEELADSEHVVPLDKPVAVQEILDRRNALAAYMVPVANAGVLSRMGRDMACCAHTTADNERAVELCRDRGPHRYSATHRAHCS